MVLAGRDSAGDAAKSIIGLWSTTARHSATSPPQSRESPGPTIYRGRRHAPHLRRTPIEEVTEVEAEVDAYILFGRESRQSLGWHEQQNAEGRCSFTMKNIKIDYYLYELQKP